MSTTAETADFMDPPQRDGEIGRLGPYRITGVLGKGGMGKVYQAEDSRLKRMVALKVMNQKFASTSNSRKRFIDEARSMAAVHHDNVATIFEVSQKDGMPYLAMEILKGNTLEQLLQDGRRFTHHEVIEIAKQSALGLNAAHERGIVHRDIKPANLWMQEPQQRVKILDFGLALAGTGVDTLSGAGSVVGTPGYLSPEQASNEPVDERTDLYSLGVVMYELCTGQIPLRGSNVPEQLIKIITHEVAPLEESEHKVPLPLAQLIHRLLSKEPGQRPATALQLYEFLGQVGEDVDRVQSEQLQIVVSPEQPGVARTGRKAKRKKTVDPVDEIEASETRSASSWGRWVAIISGFAALVAVAVYLMIRPTRVAQSVKQPPVVREQAKPEQPVTVERLKPIRFSEAKSSSIHVVPGQKARIEFNLSNEATDDRTDPKSLLGTRGQICRVVGYLDMGESSRPRLPALVVPLASRSLPDRGLIKTYSDFVSTKGLAQGVYAMDLELQTLRGQVVDSGQVSLAVSIDSVNDNSSEWEIVRTSVGDGADISLAEGDSVTAGSRKALDLENNANKSEHVVVRFDLKQLPSVRDQPIPTLMKSIEQAELRFTLDKSSYAGVTEFGVYHWTGEVAGVQANPADWKELGKDRLSWSRSPLPSKIESLKLLGSGQFDNSDRTSEQKQDAIRFASEMLVAELRACQTDTITFVLTRSTWADKPTKFRSKEASVQDAPALAIRFSAKSPSAD